MWLRSAAMFLLDHSAEIGVAVLILAGLVWLLAPRQEKKEPLKLLEARCTDQQLTLRRIELKPGSPEENWFLLRGCPDRTASALGTDTGRSAVLAASPVSTAVSILHKIVQIVSGAFLPIDAEEAVASLLSMHQWIHRRTHRRGVGILLAAVPLLCTVWAVAGSPDAEVLVPGLAVREAPDPTAPVVAELPGGTQVEVFFTLWGAGGNWAQVSLPSGGRGFVPEQTLRRLTAPSTMDVRRAGTGPGEHSSARSSGPRRESRRTTRHAFLEGFS